MFSCFVFGFQFYTEVNFVFVVVVVVLVFGFRFHADATVVFVVVFGCRLWLLLSKLVVK